MHKNGPSAKTTGDGICISGAEVIPDAVEHRKTMHTASRFMQLCEKLHLQSHFLYHAEFVKVCAKPKKMHKQRLFLAAIFDRRRFT